MTQPQTANVKSSDWEASGWILLPHNVSVVPVAPPSSPDVEQWGEPADEVYPQIKLPLEGSLTGQPSYKMVFEMLLRDYAHIWKALADR